MDEEMRTSSASSSAGMSIMGMPLAASCSRKVARSGEVLHLVSERLKVSSDFRPTTSIELIRVVEMARDIGERRIARGLLRNFERLFPQAAMQAQVEKLQQQLGRSHSRGL